MDNMVVGAMEEKRNLSDSTICGSLNPVEDYSVSEIVKLVNRLTGMISTNIKNEMLVLDMRR